MMMMIMTVLLSHRIVMVVFINITIIITINNGTCLMIEIKTPKKSSPCSSIMGSCGTMEGWESIGLGRHVSKHSSPIPFVDGGDGGWSSRKGCRVQEEVIIPTTLCQSPSRLSVHWGTKPGLFEGGGYIGTFSLQQKTSYSTTICCNAFQ